MAPPIIFNKPHHFVDGAREPCALAVEAKGCDKFKVFAAEVGKEPAPNEVGELCGFDDDALAVAVFSECTEGNERMWKERK